MKEPVFTLRNPWFTTSVAVTVSLALAASAAGFIWLPMLQGRVSFANVWDAICSAAGLLQTPRQQPVVQTSFRTTSVVLATQLPARADAESIGRGATLALRCTMCHGARGMSDANAPNLAGQYVQAVYKQLADFRSGARPSAVMGPLVAPLSDQDMRDLAAYYAYLPRPPPYHPVAGGPPPAIVLSGAPMRGIAPCGACHGGLDNKPGAAWLEGQPEAYLLAQLRAFGSGARHNDTNAQMRNVARQMTPDEMVQAARWYGSQP